MINDAIVTGVPGWLGTAFLNALRNGLSDSPELPVPKRSRIAIFSHPSSPALDPAMAAGIDAIKGDVADAAALEPFFKNAEGATVFHIAGVIHPLKSTDEFYRVNLEGTRNLLQLAIRSGVKRFIYVSSNSPCGCNASSEQRFNETSPYNPYMNYGRSKMLAEQLIMQASQEKKIETVIVRPPWFYGPYQPPRQTLFFTMIKEGRMPLVGDGNNKRSMAYVDNICQGLLLAASNEKANGEIFWIADAEPYSMNTIIETIENVLETDFKISVAHKRMRLPSIASEVAFLVDGSLQAAHLYHQKIHVLSEMNKTIACDISKARSILGYEPRIALREGMRRSIEWILAAGGKI